MSGVLLAGGPPEATLIADLKVDENGETKKAEVRFLLTEPVTIEKIEAAASGQALPVEYVPFGAEGRPDTGAILFLIDKSDPKRAKAIEAAKVLTMLLTQRSAPHTDTAIYTFDAHLDLVADFGTTWEEMAAKLKPVKAAGMATELYRTAIEAIAVLEKRPVERRALVLFSDGKAEDTTYTLEQVVEAAHRAGVTIDAVGYAETAQSTIYLQSLRRLVAETGGTFAEADLRTRRVPEDFVDRVHGLLRSGGWANIDLSGNQTGSEVQLTMALTGRPPLVTTFPLKKLAPPPVVPVPPVDPKAEEVARKVAEMAQKVEDVAKQVQEVPGKVEETARKAEEEKEAAARAAQEKDEQDARRAAAKKSRVWTTTILGLLLIAGAAAYVAWKQRPQPVVADAGPVFARLQLLDGEATEHRMTTTALRIGRGKDNDLTLGNDSVSRHHAEISRTREGVFTITELNAGNGVLVNGEQVDKAALQNEDIIELGEVRIRFLIAEGQPKPVTP